MQNVFWERLILRGFGLFEKEVALDFDPGFNILCAGNEKGKSTLVVGLAAILFGLDNDPASLYTKERFYNWQHPSRFEGELFFRTNDQHYHLQRLFINDRVRLRLWQGNSWRLLVDCADELNSDVNPSALQKELQGLLGLTSRAAFLETFCHSQAEPERLEPSPALKQLLVEQSCYPHAAIILQQNCDKLQNELQKLDLKIQDWQSTLLSQEEEADHRIRWQQRLEQLREERIQTQRRLHSLAMMSVPLAQWDEYAAEASHLLLRQEQLTKLQEIETHFSQELQPLEQEWRKLTQIAGQDYDQLQLNLKAKRQILKEIQKAEEDFLKAERSLERYKPLPLPENELIPLLERRNTLLKQQMMYSPSSSKQGFRASTAALLACFIASIIGTLVYFTWGQQQPLGILLSLAITLVTWFLSYRLLPKKSNLQAEENYKTIRKELMDQDQLLRHLHLLDGIAITGCLGLLRNLDSLRSQHQPELLLSLTNEVQTLETRYEALTCIYDQIQVIKNRLRDQNNSQDLPIIDNLTEAENQNNMALSSVFSAWRTFNQTHPDLPQISNREIQSVLTSRQELKQEEMELRFLEEKNALEEQQLKELKDNLPPEITFNCPLARQQLNLYYQKREQLNGDLESMQIARTHFSLAIADYVETYRFDLEQKIRSIFNQISGPREQELHLDSSFAIYLIHAGTKVSRDQLSQGTQDQLSFAYRLALMDQISQISQLPLILDDPLINSDAERLAQLRLILQSLATSRQIWLLSQDENYETWGKTQVFHKIP